MISKFKEIIRAVRGMLLYGNKVYCPLCDNTFRKFLRNNNRSNSRCPKCGSLERHRLFWLVFEKDLKHRIKVISGDKLVHVAPERCLEKKFRKLYDYLSIDLYSQNVMKRMDVTALDLNDESVDVFVCNHVLEHVQDDKKAIAEIFRVLKTNGWASLQVPIKGEATLEDPTIVSEADRLKYYGQEDHVRQFGMDVIERFKDAGFSVGVYTPDQFEKTVISKIDPEGVENEIIICEKLM